MKDMQLEVSPENRWQIELIDFYTDLRDDEVFPREFYEPLRRLWNDKGVQQAWQRRNEAALPEKCAFPLFFLFLLARQLNGAYLVWHISSLI